MCFPAGPVGADISLLISETVQSRLLAAVKRDSIDTASELLSETLVEACKEAGLNVVSFAAVFRLVTSRNPPPRPFFRFFPIIYKRQRAR